MPSTGNEFVAGVHGTLGIRQIEGSPDRVVLEMDVDERVHQPFGILHGGVSAVLAESAASLGCYLNCDVSTEYCVGIDLNINHLRARRSGVIRAKAEPIRKGRSIHVWGIDIVDENEEPVAVARCTLAVRKLQGSETSQGG